MRRSQALISESRLSGRLSSMNWIFEAAHASGSRTRYDILDGRERDAGAGVSSSSVMI